MNGYKIVLLKAILCFIGCRKVNGYAPEYVSCKDFSFVAVNELLTDLLRRIARYLTLKKNLCHKYSDFFCKYFITTHFVV